MTTSLKKTVLVVDDEDTIRTMLDRVLSPYYGVRLAANGAEAVAEIQQQRPDVIILDLRMPVMDGWQLLEWLEKAGHAVPVIVISAEVRSPPVTSPLVRARLTKPVSIRTLREACEAVLGSAGGDDEGP